MRTVLLTGGTGKTGRRIASRLASADIRVRLVARSLTVVESCDSVLFDWSDASTFEAALSQVDAVYLLAPSNVSEPLEAMRPFIDLAIKNGVRRFVLLSASSLPKGGPLLGAVHQYLAENAPEWTVLRPSWFMQNFSEQQHLLTIMDEGAIYSATGDGLIPFIDAGDIAAVAATALTQREPLNRDLILTGPQLITYTDVARIISTTIGRPVKHVMLTERQLKERFERMGMAPEYASLLSSLDTAIAGGSEERLTCEVEDMTDRPPKTFSDFAVENKLSWERVD
ncbi:ergot alkaloid biosynthesis protein [Hahella aquimaris]|uniref:ergot alkaloid biosynthesis protein n=1 Tax=Hahella sp. HNIBRBA332 TaxID=3015983 RepID=UPI00273B3E73|nr:ergot alkaloid biosynthesis protein [Hahella sp. HNIBRBA332]WLQ16350.1 ergot alkaloid biosynthesis protein [Hahella sp. HNIBRBA332]